MDPGVQQLLDEGIASLRIGNKEEARRKLMQVINADERNEHGWLYLSEAVESDEDRQICLENVLTINPANDRAERELKALQEKMARGQVKEGDLICPSCGVTNPPGTLPG
jgi:predicted Zn-dependent protease